MTYLLLFEWPAQIQFSFVPCPHHLGYNTSYSVARVFRGYLLPRQVHQILYLLTMWSHTEPERGFEPRSAGYKATALPFEPSTVDYQPLVFAAFLWHAQVIFVCFCLQLDMLMTIFLHLLTCQWLLFLLFKVSFCGLVTSVCSLLQTCSGLKEDNLY